ncbi:SPX domain-containing protein [Spinellus fusiger]|nr:SPX domain-containing protein [Spinellus fusiger]
MKFSHQIQFNAVPDWADHYLPYSNLKKLIYTMEKDRVTDGQEHHDTTTNISNTSNEYTALMSNQGKQYTNAPFTTALDKSLDKIIKFYAKKETELYDTLDQLESDLASFFHRQSSHNDEESTLGEDTSAPVHRSADFPRRESTVDGDALPATVISQNLTDNYCSYENTTAVPAWVKNDGTEATHELKRRIISLFVLLSELKSFVALNLTAFAKILKKYDKITDSNLKRDYTNGSVQRAYPFKSATKSRLNERIQQTEKAYALLETNNNFDQAIDELKSHLREHIVWERNTVWRDMVGQERRVQTVGVEESTSVTIRLPLGTIKLSRDQAIQMFLLFSSIIAFVILLQVEIFPQEEQNRCFAILVFASILWAGEVMPLFVTALLVPLLIVTLRVMRSDDGHFTRLTAPEATKRVFASMFSPVIMLLLGGFSIAGALSKFGIAKSMATFVLSKAGTSPNRVLLVNMMVATMASMWISNVAAPVLCFSLIQPILRTLPVDSQFAPCLIIGIALASNLGGMASPISSPQNIIAIQNMDPAPSWAEWFTVSIPLCLVGNFIIWLWLTWTYKPEKKTPYINAIRASNDPITGTQVYVAFVTLATIVMWCLAHTYQEIFGDMGIIAIFPILAFFGTGLLTKDDFNNFLWNVIVLAMGGIALGKSVESSGLLKTIAEYIETLVTGMTAFQVLFVFSCLVLVIATFISHTVAALIVLPIVAEVGSRMEDPKPRMLVMGTAFMCSAAMGLPVSGFPNMNAIAQENELGQPYLTTKDFILNGVPSSVFAMLCVTTLGYLIMTLIGL